MNFFDSIQGKAAVPLICFFAFIGINNTTGQNDTSKAWVMLDSTFQHIHVDTPATYKNGNKSFLIDFYGVLEYPRKARANGDQGVVIYRFEVTKEGEVENLELVQSASYELDSAVQATIKIVTKGQVYSPAFLNGKAVRSRVEMPVKFSLQ